MIDSMFRVRLKLKYRCSVQITRYYYYSRGRAVAVVVVVISSGIGAVLFPCSRGLRDSLSAQVCVCLILVVSSMERFFLGLVSCLGNPSVFQ